MDADLVIGFDPSAHIDAETRARTLVMAELVVVGIGDGCSLKGAEPS